jgi:hypothetical protein
MNDREGKAILRRWPDTTALFRWREGRKLIKAHPPNPQAQYALFGGSGSKTFADGAYISVDEVNSNRARIADVLFIEICASRQNFGDKRSRYAPSHEARSICLSANWFRKKIRWPGRGGQTSIFKALGLDSPPTDKVEMLVRALRVLYVLPDNDLDEVMRSEVPRGYEFFATDSWFRNTVPNWPKEEPEKRWGKYAHQESAFPPSSTHREQARRFFDLNQHFLK